MIRERDREQVARLYQDAYDVKVQQLGKKVFFRGLIELSNHCVKDCYYCGLRRSNGEMERFEMTHAEVLELARFAEANRFGSIVLQAGERCDQRFVTWIEELLSEIRSATGDALAITLSLGEQSKEVYERWRQAGATRYLLRIETSNPKLYRALHPADHRYETRIRCLEDLKSSGYQVGTGVMIGLPGQTAEDLAEDILFFRRMDVDMVGMGPYLRHAATPLGRNFEDSDSAADRSGRFELGLKMIAATRLTLPDINIAATTALQALHPQGRELGLKAGANVIMPALTDPRYKRNYRIYDDRPCIDDDARHCRSCLDMRIRSIGEEVAYGEAGDPLHYQARKAVTSDSPCATADS